MICLCENYILVQFLLSNSIESDTHVLHLPCEVYIACDLEIKMWCSSFLSTTAPYFSIVWSPLSQKLMPWLGRFLTIQTPDKKNLKDQKGNVPKQILLCFCHPHQLSLCISCCSCQACTRGCTKGMPPVFCLRNCNNRYSEIHISWMYLLPSWDCFTLGTLYWPLHVMLYASLVNLFAKESELFTHTVFQLVICDMALCESIHQEAVKVEVWGEVAQLELYGG